MPVLVRVGAAESGWLHPAFDRATAIEEFLSEHYRRVPDAPSGHAYPNLQFFLFGPRDHGGLARRLRTPLAGKR